MTGAALAANRQLHFYRRLWKSNMISQVVQPLLYLLGLGIGVGALVDRNGTPELGAPSYVAFVAPGLLVTSAMSVAAFESMWPVMGSLKWDRSYFAASATPLDARDLVAGHALWMAVRTLITSALVAVVLALFPDTRSWGLIAAVGVCTLVGVAFAMPLMAIAVTAQLDGTFAALQRFVIIPLFLFGGAFYPLTQLPTVVQWVAKAAPLWHGVVLARGSTVGGLRPMTAIGHLAYVLAWAAAGTIVATRRLRRVLYV
jgi:lipooligosaccharide transport system permease protein